MRRIPALVVATTLALCALVSPASAATAARTALQAQQAETACGPGGVGDALVPDRGP